MHDSEYIYGVENIAQKLTISNSDFNLLLSFNSKVLKPKKELYLMSINTRWYRSETKSAAEITNNSRQNNTFGTINFGQCPLKNTQEKWQLKDKISYSALGKILEFTTTFTTTFKHSTYLTFQQDTLPKNSAIIQ